MPSIVVEAVHIRSALIRNIRSLNDVHWRIDSQPFSGWHVVIGDNASGKSAFLRAIALALVGPTGALALRQDWATWLSHGQNAGRVRLHFKGNDVDDPWAGKGRILKNYYPSAGMAFSKGESGV